MRFQDILSTSPRLLSSRDGVSGRAQALLNASARYEIPRLKKNETAEFELLWSLGQPLIFMGIHLQGSWSPKSFRDGKLAHQRVMMLDSRENKPKSTTIANFFEIFINKEARGDAVIKLKVSQLSICLPPLSHLWKSLRITPLPPTSRQSYLTIFKHLRPHYLFQITLVMMACSTLRPIFHQMVCLLISVSHIVITCMALENAT